MKNKYLVVSLLLMSSVLFVTSALVIAEPVEGSKDQYKSEVIEYGYYEKLSELKRRRNIATTSGYVREGGEVKLAEQSQDIPLQLNRLFGFRFRIAGFKDKSAVQLKLVVTHPEIKRPNGSTSKGYSYPVLLDVKNGVINNQSGYSIDHDYEMVEGSWTFEYWYNNKKLLSQSFKTFANDAKTDSDGAS